MKNRSQTASKVGLLGSLYFSQGLPFGFFTQALPVLMRKQGYSLESIGLASLLAAPWALKFMWAPFVDKYGSDRFGRRRSWIVPLQLTTIITLACIALFHSSENLSLILGFVFLINLLSATQDIGTDGLAVDILSPSERGLGNGVQVAGYRLGMIIGGGLMLIIFDVIQWVGTFAAMAGMIALASLPILFHKEAPKPIAKQEAGKISILDFFKRPGIGKVILLILIYKTGDAFATAMLRPLMADLGFSLSDIGWLLGTVGFITGLLGALAGGALVNPLGRKRALVIFAFLQTLAVSGYALVSYGFSSLWLVYFLCGVEHFAGGMATAALFTCMMDWCRPESSATDYTIQASLVVFATGLAATLSGFSASAFGYTAHFTLATGLAFFSVMAVYWLFPGPEGVPVQAMEECMDCS